MLRYHWSKLDEDARKRLADASSGELDEVTRRALKRFYADYGLPEWNTKPGTERARSELIDAIEKKELPGWVLNLSRDLLED